MAASQDWQLSDRWRLTGAVLFNAVACSGDVGMGEDVDDAGVFWSDAGESIIEHDVRDRFALTSMGWNKHFCGGCAAMGGEHNNSFGRVAGNSARVGCVE